MRLRKWLFLFLIVTSLLECKLPTLTPRKTREKLEEVLKGHASYKALSRELMARIFISFLEELDPVKTYLLDSEIDKWISPSTETLSRALQEYKGCSYSSFQEMHAVFLKAVERRDEIEGRLAEEALPANVKREEFADLSSLPWASSAEELEARISKIKALQVESAAKMGAEGKSRFLQLLEKRRINREAHLKGDGEGAEGIEKIVLATFLKAAMASLDSHTNYFTPTEANQFMIQVQQRLFGIGAQLRDDLDGLVVVRILENSPASASGKLKINDKIIAVNGDPVVGLDIQEAVELIRGPKGTKVLLSIVREEGVMAELELTRGEVLLEESRLETFLEPYGDGVIATLRLFSFYQDPQFSSASDMRKALEEIQNRQTLKGVVLDLRGNGGGLLSQAVSVTGLFITKGIVVSVKDDLGMVQHLRETEGNPAWDGPLLVLVNKASASAAEIVAQTLQDYGRALVVGDKTTFGKGSFQTFTLDPIHNPKVNPEGEYKVTRGKYYTVSGKSPQLEGVASDIVVPGLLSSMDLGEKFAKYPLPNDEISAHFEDDLSDVSAFQRLKLGASYRQNLQPHLTTYVPYLKRLQENSKIRIENNKNYQAFLAEIEKKNFDSLQVELFDKHDLQGIEAVNVMKDLIYLREAS